MPKSKRRVLIVEDHEATRHLVHSFLKSAGIGADLVENGMQAIEYLKGHKPDLIVTDLIMPHVDGLSLARQVQSHPETASIPVILLSAVRTPDLERRSQDAGVRTFLDKPFRRRELVRAVEAVLDAGGVQASSTV